MDYERHYTMLVENAKSRNWTKNTAGCYVEIHHIIPKCMGGLDTDDNLVCLTPEEHYVAHQLLYKIYKNTEFNRKLIYAAKMMCNKTGARSNKVYAWVRRNHARAISEQNSKYRHSDEIKEAMSVSRKGKKHSVETRQKMSEAQKGKTHSIESRQKMSEAHKGKTLSDATRQKMSEAHKGKTAWNKNISGHRKDYTHTDETRQKISDGCKKQPRVACPYCDAVGTKSNMTRWHFDNCKHIGTNNE